MADRKRSSDGSKDTEKIPVAKGSVSQQGRAGGDLQRDVGTQDDRKRATERPAGTTRVTGADKRSHGTEPEDDSK